MNKVKLTKVTSTHNNLRTNEVEGVCTALPEVGQCFSMTAPPLESGNVRWVCTSPVAGVETLAPGLIRFRTENSTYTLEVQP